MTGVNGGGRAYDRPMGGLLRRIWAKLRRINGTANVSGRMSGSTHRDQAGGPRGGADGWGGGGGMPPG